jgi:8-oxo-dGTP pyrophosphatase MutT (NUDIX family)
MHRRGLLELLARHVPSCGAEAEHLAAMQAFVEREPGCFERNCLEGHVTASAWIVDRTRRLTLLTHHAKLGRWLQPGGHADGETDVLAVALREALEETGLTVVPLLGGAIFDVDVHEIPERGPVPAHLHYDVRFLCEADPAAALTVTVESHALAWHAVAEVAGWSGESMARFGRKTMGMFPQHADQATP